MDFPFLLSLSGIVISSLVLTPFGAFAYVFDLMCSGNYNIFNESPKLLGHFSGEQVLFSMQARLAVVVTF